MLWKERGDTLGVARALSNLANVVKLQGDYVHAGSLCAECLSMFREVGDKTGVAWTLNQQADVARKQGDGVAARALCEQSVGAFRELADREGVASSLADLGNLACDQGDYRTGDSFYRESIAVFQALEHRRGVARLLECFACSAAAQAQSERSFRLVDAAAALRESIGVPLTQTEQSKLEEILGPDWSRHRTISEPEGWAIQVERAIAEVLKPSCASHSN